MSISDLRRDSQNINRGTTRGKAALRKSVEDVGWADPGVMSADGVVLAGNHRLDVAKERGDDPIIIDVDGTKPVFIRRTDVQSGTAEAVKIAMLSNRVGQLNYSPDNERAVELTLELGIEPAEVAFEPSELTVFTPPPPIPAGADGGSSGEGGSDGAGATRMAKGYAVVVNLDTIEDANALKRELEGDGLRVNVITL